MAMLHNMQLRLFFCAGSTWSGMTDTEDEHTSLLPSSNAKASSRRGLAMNIQQRGTLSYEELSLSECLVVAWFIWHGLLQLLLLLWIYRFDKWFSWCFSHKEWNCWPSFDRYDAKKQLLLQNASATLKLLLRNDRILWCYRISLYMHHMNHIFHCMFYPFIIAATPKAARSTTRSRSTQQQRGGQDSSYTEELERGNSSNIIISICCWISRSSSGNSRCSSRGSSGGGGSSLKLLIVAVIVILQ